jgi:hypothetical protein
MEVPEYLRVTNIKPASLDMNMQMPEESLPVCFNPHYFILVFFIILDSVIYFLKPVLLSV